GAVDWGGVRWRRGVAPAPQPGLADHRSGRVVQRRSGHARGRGRTRRRRRGLAPLPDRRGDHQARSGARPPPGPGARAVGAGPALKGKPHVDLVSNASWSSGTARALLRAGPTGPGAGATRGGRTIASRWFASPDGRVPDRGAEPPGSGPAGSETLAILTGTSDGSSVRAIGGAGRPCRHRG